MNATETTGEPMVLHNTTAFTSTESTTTTKIKETTTTTEDFGEGTIKPTRKPIKVKPPPKARVNMEDNRVHFRHLMLFFYRKGKNAIQTAREICEVYGDDAVGERT
ncbi:hypothetical protein TELCIR_05772, partial [Teladorsagia circumcincta]